MTARTVAIVQARMGSTRLPGKVKLPLLGQPVLSRVMRRAGRARTLDEVVVATTTRPDDDAIVRWQSERAGPSSAAVRPICSTAISSLPAPTTRRSSSGSPLTVP